MATVTNTLPITGVPLPFFSYGGTALATTLAAVGVLLSIARHGSGSALRNNRGSDEAFDRWRRDRRGPLSRPPGCAGGPPRRAGLGRPPWWGPRGGERKSA